MAWKDLGRRAKTWRVLHGAWSIAQLGSLAYIWACVATGRRDARVWGSVAFLGIEGAALAIGRGNCPMAQVQEGFGDAVPFFELVLPPRAAKAAIPILAATSAGGIVLLVLRSPGLALRSPR